MTDESLKMEITSTNEAVLTLDDGTTKNIIRETHDNIENNKLRYKVDPSTFTYIYFQTTYTDTETQGDLEELALELFSYMPYVGWIGTLAGIIEEARNAGIPKLYIKIDHYHTASYVWYKYENYFYKDAARKKS